MKINKLLESKRTDDYLSIKEINWLKDNPGQEIKKTHYKVSYNDYVNANTNEPMGGHFTVIENRGRDTTRVDGVQELKDYIVRRYNKYFNEDVSYEWKPNTSFKHIKDIYNKVKANDYKFVNNEREEFMKAVHKAHDKGYKPEECRQIKDWWIDIHKHDTKNEDYSHFEFTSGSNPYIAKTKDEAERIKRSRGDSVRFVDSINGIDYYKVDDSEKDLFRVDESKQLNETEYGKDVTYPSIKTSRIPRNATKLKGIGRHNGESNTFVKTKSGWTYDHNGVYVNPDTIRYGYTDVEVLETDPNYKPNRTKPEYVVQGNYGYGWEDLTASDNQAEARNDLKAYRENETGVAHRLITRRVPVTENLKEAFKPSDSGIQSVKCYNRYNYTIQELRVDNDNKTFERGNFTAGKADKKTKNRQEFEDIVDTLKELGYTEIKSDYRSMRNKSRKGTPTNVEEGYELSPRIDYNPNHLRDEEGKVMADRWYASKWPDDKVGIEQLKGITLDDALKDRSILGHCDTQVRERVYAQLDKYIPLSKESPMYKEKNESKSIDESKATHCVYFEQDGIEQVEFEGTEDECERYISAIQAEQDDEFGDEAPERFIKRLTEGHFSDDDVEDDIEHANLYGGDTMYCRDCGTKKKWDDGYSYCPKCNGELNESALKVGDKVYVTVSKKNGKVTKVNGDYITVETDDGKNPIRIDTYYANEVKKLDEAHYGGAFDIRDDEFWTRDDLNDFAEEVINNINEIFYTEYKILGVWSENGNIIVSIGDEEGNEYETTQRIDMRKIRKSSDLTRHYVGYVVYDLRKQIEEVEGVSESLKEEDEFEFDDEFNAYYDGFTHGGSDEPELGNKFFADGYDWTWFKQMGETLHLDFDNWAVWWAYRPEEENNPDSMAVSAFFVVDTDTGFIDWGPCDTYEEARDFLNGKKFDWDSEFDTDDNGWSDDLDEGIDNESPILHRKGDGSYLIAADDGYTAFTKSDVCMGHITATNEQEAKNKFNANQFDENLNK